MITVGIKPANFEILAQLVSSTLCFETVSGPVDINVSQYNHDFLDDFNVRMYLRCYSFWNQPDCVAQLTDRWPSIPRP